MHESTTAHDPSVTVVISRRVKPGCEAEFETFLEGVTTACRQFPGHLGCNVFRPSNADDPEYRVIFKFDRQSNLRRWETSNERQQWFAMAESLTLSPPSIQVLTGLETWFTLPGKPAIVPPPRYKMAIVTWLAVFPLITAISIVLQNQLSLLPTVLRVMVVTGIAVPTMTYLLMPQMTRLFAQWLYPTEQSAEPEEEVVPAIAPGVADSLPDLQPLPASIGTELLTVDASTAR
jgi:uncharacterized protein